MIKRVLPLLALCLALNGCAYLGSSFKVDELNKAEVHGTQFHKELVDHYRARANDSENVTLDYEQAYDNAERGLLAADGQDVAPLDPNDFNIPPVLRPDIDAARNELTNLLSQQARQFAPQESALAQTKFDCWVEDAAKNWAPDMYQTCKAGFGQAVSQLKNMLGAPPEIKEIAQQGQVAVQQAQAAGRDIANFYIFFGKSSNLPTTATHSLDVIAEMVKQKQTHVIQVFGYADAKGSKKANLKVSQRRATAVAQGLMARGISVQQMQIAGKGASNFLVPGKKGSQSPANRRVEVKLID